MIGFTMPDSAEPGLQEYDCAAKSQKPKAKSQKPKAKSQKPKAKSQKPKAKSQKPKAKSLQMRACRPEVITEFLQATVLPVV
ncbi:MAG: hypothetical protein AAF432_15335, partial [Planctomycetota bacterium]